MGKRTTEDVINIFKNIHGDRYDYSKFHYEGAKKTSTIICKKHGEFYKIGKTYRKVSIRFKTKTDIPYGWEICNEFIFDCSRECSEYEDKLRKINKHNRYIPTLSFGGRYECYKEMPIIPENDLKIK